MGDPHRLGVIVSRHCLCLSAAGGVGDSANDETCCLATGGVFRGRVRVSCPRSVELDGLTVAHSFILVSGYFCEDVRRKGQVLTLHEPTHEGNRTLRVGCDPVSFGPAVDRLVQIGGSPTVSG